VLLSQILILEVKSGDVPAAVNSAYINLFCEFLMPTRISEEATEIAGSVVLRNIPIPASVSDSCETTLSPTSFIVKEVLEFKTGVPASAIRFVMVLPSIPGAPEGPVEPCEPLGPLGPVGPDGPVNPDGITTSP
jgi:hypothetical protein